MGSRSSARDRRGRAPRSGDLQHFPFDVAQHAIDALRAHGLASSAAELERELGTPAERLRADQPEW